MKMRSKRLLILLIQITSCVFAFPQTQQGYVKTLGRPDKKGVALSGVSVRVKGEHNAVLSKSDGTFFVQMSGKKNGDAYALQQVQKSGYELNEQGVIGRQYAFSDKVPLTIVMVSTAQLQADKQRIENNAYQVAERNYKVRLAHLEKQMEDNAITIEEYRKQLQDLQDKFDKYQSLIDGLADHYAHVDYDNLDEKEREINLCIENGDLERADSLIHTLFDPTDVLKRNKEAIDKIEQQESQAREILAQANADMTAVLKQQEKDAEYLYQLYTIALSRFDNDKALQYIETRVALDTTNVKWLIESGKFVEDYYGDYSKAMEFYQRALNHSLLQYGEENEYTAVVRNDIGAICSQQGDYSKALEYFSKTLEICDKDSGTDQSLVARLYNNIGFVYFAQGEYNKAMEYFVKGCNVLENSLGVEHPDVAMTYGNIGSIYYTLGDYSLSLDYQLKSLAVLEKIFSTDHPYVAYTYNEIGSVYYLQKDYPKAMEFLSKALLICEKVLGKEHPNVALSYNNIGNVYLKQKNYPQALEYISRALSIREIVLGMEHPQTATSFNNIGGIYYEQANYPKALEYYFKALAIRKKVLGMEHPVVAESYSNIGKVYEKQNLYSKALDYFSKALAIDKKTFGERHPYTIKDQKDVDFVNAKLNGTNK